MGLSPLGGRPLDTGGWFLDFGKDESGRFPARDFLGSLSGTPDAEAAAIALLRLAGERGNALREPHSKALGQGLFELRDRKTGVRIFYMFRPRKVIMLLGGIVKKRDDIPPEVLKRIRVLQGRISASGR